MMNKWAVIIIGALAIFGVAHYVESTDVKTEQEDDFRVCGGIIPTVFPEGTKSYTQSNIDTMENVEIKLVFKINSSYKDCLIDWIAAGSWLENVTLNCPDDYFEIDHFEMGELYWDIKP